MATFFVLEDGRIWGASNGVFDHALEMIAAVLEPDEAGRLLADWLLGQRCEVMGPGVGYLDLRELTPANAARISRAIGHAYKRACDYRGDDRLMPLGLENFALLVRMTEAVERGEPPELLTSEAWRPFPTSERSGPGWE